MTIELEDLKVWCYYTNIELDVAIRNMKKGEGMLLYHIELDVTIRNMKKGGYDHRVGRFKVWCYYTNIELDVAIRNMKKGGYDHRVWRS